MSKAELIINKLNDISALIHEAQVNLGNGSVMNLSHLDREVSQICDDLLKLPPVEAKKAQTLMAEVIGKLETLADSLKNFKSKLKEKIK